MDELSYTMKDMVILGGLYTDLDAPGRSYKEILAGSYKGLGLYSWLHGRLFSYACRDGSPR